MIAVMRPRAGRAHLQVMSKILLWRNDGELPHCRMLLGNGDLVAIRLSAEGVQIDRLGCDGMAAESLFRGDADIATGICIGLLDGKPPQSTTPLDVLATAIAPMPSAAAVRGAFTDAARGLPTGRSSATPRVVVIALLLLALLLAGLTGYKLMIAPPA